MSRRAPLPVPFDREPFTVDRARAAGVERSRLRASDLTAPFRGVRVRGPAPVTMVNLCSAFESRMTASQFFSHVTAAELYGIPLPRTLESSGRLHVSVAPPQHPPRSLGVIGHRVAVSSEVRTYRGHRVTSPELTWCQLALVLGVDDLVVAGDFLVRRKRPLSTLAKLTAAIATLGDGRGAKAARCALARVRAGTDSPRETRLRLLIVAGELPEPLIGYVVKDADGFFVATPDLAYVRERIAIEYEGDHHRTDPRVYAEDIERRELLEDAGWLVIRVVSDHIRLRPGWLVQRISRALIERAAI